MSRLLWWGWCVVLGLALSASGWCRSAVELVNRGNDYFNQRECGRAIEQYTKALRKVPTLKPEESTANLTAGDSPFLKPLVTRTAQAFTLREVSADKAYSSDKNINTIEAFHATPYIPLQNENGRREWLCAVGARVSLLHVQAGRLLEPLSQAF